MDHIAIVAALAGTVWAATSTIFSSYKLINDIRDKIIFGKSDGHQLTLEHRSLMLTNDYKPLSVGMAFTSLMYSIMVLSIPLLSSDPLDRWATALCIGVSMWPLSKFFANAFYGIEDYFHLKDMLERERKDMVSLK